ncbi:MAG: SUMF1/EgtB/PvdO family nonheme iron enzyme [Caldilineaceae bacterium]|nr:SUMF1/EgtB/PvdO family nonheme iron enzyme [Caldilineaceae bacterium]
MFQRHAEPRAEKGTPAQPTTPPAPSVVVAPRAVNRGAPAGTTPLGNLAGLDAAAPRVIAIRLAMDEALERWWTVGELPPLALLRDGLLLLEAGHSLDETQRTFLLRVALRRQRGMITALRYQGDPDRTAFLLKDALLDSKHPLPAELIHQLQQEDEQSPIWMDYLLHDLQYELGVAQGPRRQLVVNVLALIQRKPPLWMAMTTAGRAQPLLLPLSQRWSVRWLLWGSLLLCFSLGYVAVNRTVYAQSIRIPAGSYTISDSLSEGRMRTVVLADFRLDLTEVTNAAYARCYADGVCDRPGSLASATREEYFTDGAYANFPVVNVGWDDADRYCTWLGKRLPTLEEWEVAAGVAPATQRYFRYPWGEQFDPNFANGGNSRSIDTRVVGAYHPMGDSSFGLRDMAGNVAEWTASPSPDLFNAFVVKGGSYRDPADHLRLDAQQLLVGTTQAPWLGFRCASD